MGLNWRQSLLDALSSVNEQIAAGGQAVGRAAEYYSQPENSVDVNLPIDAVAPPQWRVPNPVSVLQDVIAPTQPMRSPMLSEVAAPEAPSTQDQGAEAIFPQEESSKSYVETVAKEMTRFGIGLVADPLTYTPMGGGIAGKVGVAAFTGMAAKGAYDAASKTIEKYDEAGKVTPDVVGEGTSSLLQAGAAYLGGKHLSGAGERKTVEAPPIADAKEPPFVQIAQGDRTKLEDMQKAILKMPEGEEKTKAIEAWFEEKKKLDTVQTTENQITPRQPPDEGPATDALPVEVPKDTFLDTRKKEGISINNTPEAPQESRLPPPRGTPGWKKAEQFVTAHPAWKTFSDWYEMASEVAKKKLMALPDDVRPPSDLIKNQIPSLANTPFKGADFKPGKYASNWVRKIRSTVGGVLQPGAAVESIGHDINILAYMKDMVSDIQRYPHFAERIAKGDPKILQEEMLRRMLWTNIHEMIHSLGVEHPLVDTGTPDVYDFERQNYYKKFLDSPQITPRSEKYGDIRMYKMMRAAVDSYTSGDLDHLMEAARPHFDEWRRLFAEAHEISRRPETVSPVVPRQIPPRAIPPEGGVGDRPGGGIPPGGVPGDPGSPGEAPPAGPGSGPVIPPGDGGPPFRPSDKPPKTDWSKLPQHGIKEFINLRRAAITHARAARFQFKDLAGQGMDWIKKFENGEAVPGGDRVKALFDKLIAEEKRYGVPIKERPNYIYHLWKESPESVRRTFRRLGIRPSFTNERIFDTYEAGIKAGLTPKYDNPVDIIAERVRQHKKLIADKGLYNTLRAGKLIKPINKAPQDWVPIRNFPFHRYTTGKFEHIQAWAAPLPVAERLNRYLDSPISSPIRDFFQKVAQVSTDVKNVVMSSGIPNTLFNAHGFNTAMRIAASKGSPMAALGEAAKVPFKLLNSGEKYKKYLDDNLDDIARFQEAGGTFNIEDHPFKIVEGETVPKDKKSFWQNVRDARESHGTTVGRNYAALRKIHEQLFEDPLFQAALPAWKLEFMKSEETRLLEKGIKPEEAVKLAAHSGNVLLGGINWEGDAGLKGDPQFRTALRIVFNAPDWAETNLRIAKGTMDWLKHPKDPKFQMYKHLVQNTFMFYVISNAISRGLSNEQDPTERHFQARIGKASSGRSRFIKPLGTGADWVRLPYEIIAKLSHGDLSGASDVVKNRLHPLAQGMFNVALNRNYWGRPLTGKDLPVLTQAGRLAHEVTDVAAPSYVKAPVAAFAGEAGPEETIMKSIEAPVAYARPGGRDVASPYSRGRGLARRFQVSRRRR